jgi:glutamate--cysteine ligase
VTDLLPSTDRPIHGPPELEAFFRASERRGSPRRLGIELEIAAVTDDLAPAPFAGPRSISALLERLVATGAWQPLREHGRTIGLARPASGERIALEPGCQLELVGAPERTLGAVVSGARARLVELVQAARESGLVLLGGGLQPFARLDALPFVPKERYAILRRHLARAGGVTMMKKTQSLQVSLDWEDERDAELLTAAAHAATPVLAALTASSPFEDGRATRELSRRLLAWEATDPARTGFAPASSYRSYVDSALDVPLVFRRERGHYHPAPSWTFRELLRRGSWPDGAPVTLGDWELHLTSIFTHVRWKRVIELRVMDAPLPEEVFAPVALVVGLLEHRPTRDAVLERLGRARDLEVALADAARRGLRGGFAGRSLREWAVELVALARRGLEARVAQGIEPASVLELLDPLEARAASGETPAEELLRVGVGGLVERLRYREEALLVARAAA